MAKLINKISLVDGRVELKEIGSKDEKMSVIIDSKHDRINGSFEGF